MLVKQAHGTATLLMLCEMTLCRPVTIVQDGMCMRERKRVAWPGGVMVTIARQPSSEQDRALLAGPSALLNIVQLVVLPKVGVRKTRQLGDPFMWSL